MRERLTRFFGQCAIGACMVLSCAMVSCTQDNLHLPDYLPGAEQWETYSQEFPGKFSTTVPLVQEYLQGPVVCPTIVRIENFHAEHSGYVRLFTEVFSVDDPFVVDLLGMTIEIGQMRIDSVEYAAFPSGGGYLRKQFDNVKAGAYNTRGTIEGTIGKDGKLSLVMNYRPGTMPFDIVTEFKQTEK